MSNKSSESKPVNLPILEKDIKKLFYATATIHGLRITNSPKTSIDDENPEIALFRASRMRLAQKGAIFAK